jgi:8-oxo-dGTP diphosphatase
MLRRAQRVLLGVYRLLPRNLRRVVVRSFAPSFTVGAICVVERPDGRVLVVRHSYRRRWGFPGGLVKRNEAIEDAARREAREEVGVDIVLVDEPAVVVAPEPRRVDVVFRARVAEGFDPDALRPTSPEILEVRWVQRRDLPELQDEAADGLVALARRVGSG